MFYVLLPTPFLHTYFHTDRLLPAHHSILLWNCPSHSSWYLGDHLDGWDSSLHSSQRRAKCDDLSQLDFLLGNLNSNKAQRDDGHCGNKSSGSRGSGGQWSCIHKPSSEKAETQRKERIWLVEKFTEWSSNIKRETMQPKNEDPVPGLVQTYLTGSAHFCDIMSTSVTDYGRLVVFSVLLISIRI